MSEFTVGAIERELNAAYGLCSTENDMDKVTEALVEVEALRNLNTELLEALQVAAEALCDLPLMDPRIIAIRAALAKATGEA